jgi:transcriptional regulator with XRE-family HTH domain
MSTLIRLVAGSGRTQTEIAATARLSRSQLSDVLRGKKSLSIRSLHALLTALQAQPEQAWSVLGEFAAQASGQSPTTAPECDLIGVA